MCYIKYVHGSTGSVSMTVESKSVRDAIAYLEEHGFQPEWYEQDRKLPHSFIDDSGNRAFILKEVEFNGRSS